MSKSVQRRLQFQVQDEDVKRIEKDLKDVSPKNSRNFLINEGILDKEGRLTEYGEHILGRMASEVTNHAE
jgi:hypothetical protein